MKNPKKDLVQLIKDNPDAIFTIDNDHWTMHSPMPKPNNEMTEDEFEDWQENGRITQDGEVIPLGDGAFPGNGYGGDILQALAVIVGVKLESF